MAGNPPNLPTENIDEVILRLLALEPNEVDELDYQTYKQYLKELLIEVDRGRKIGGDEAQLIRKEFKRVRAKTGRFKIKVKRIKLTSNNLGLGGIKNKVAASQKRLMIAPSGGIPKEKENIDSISSGGDNLYKILERINNSLDSIIGTLTDINNLNRSRIERERKNSETKKRTDKEKELESKIGGIKKAISTITKPFQSIWDRIVNFIKNVILGRIFIKLIEWIADPNNQGKIQSIIRFFKDHWPTLLALYLRFGTGIGRFVGKLGGILIKGAFKLGALATKLLLKAGIGKAGGKLSKVAGFLGGRRGKAVATGLGIAADVAVTAGAAVGIEKLMGGGEQPTQKFSGGGSVRYPKFSGGGFNFKGMMGGAGMGAMFGPLGMLLGAGVGSGMFSGLVKGPGGSKEDKIPAMLSNGEFVMSAGAVQKYGVDTFEAMNAAGGGDNKPKIMGGTTYAAGGGYIGESNEPFSKNPIGAIKRFIDYKFGVDIDKRSTWGLPAAYQAPKSQGVPTGSLLTNPMQAMSRIGSRYSMNMPEVPSGMKLPGVPSGMKLPGVPSGMKLPGVPSGMKLPGVPSGMKLPGVPSGMKLPGVPKGKGFLPGPVQEVLDKLKGPGAATFRNAGNIYLKQMLGGFGGPISERDLAPESQAELQKAIQRAKKRTGSEIKKVEGEIQKLKGMGAKDGNPALERQKSFLEKLKKGGIRVQYTDYADEKGQMSESAKNSKNILGQFWAYERDKKEGGGYRIEDKYDFDMFKKKVKDPNTGKMVERDLTGGELWNEVFLGKGKTLQQRLQALYLLNRAKGKGDVDMILGGKRTAAESWGLSSSKTLLGGMLGASGKPKDKNTQALEAKRPWWDKLGMFGGASAQMKREQQKKQEFLKKNSAAKLYNKPQKNTGQSYKSKFARPKNSGVSPAKPPVKPSTKPSTTPYRGGQRSGRSNTPNSQRPKSVNPTHPKGTRTAKSTLGINK